MFICPCCGELFKLVKIVNNPPIAPVWQGRIGYLTGTEAFGCYNVAITNPKTGKQTILLLAPAEFTVL